MLFYFFWNFEWNCVKFLDFYCYDICYDIWKQRVKHCSFTVPCRTSAIKFLSILVHSDIIDLLIYSNYNGNHLFLAVKKLFEKLVFFIESLKHTENWQNLCKSRKNFKIVNNWMFFIYFCWTPEIFHHLISFSYLFQNTITKRETLKI